MTYERPSPYDYEYESDYIEALEKWLDYQEYLSEYEYEKEDDYEIQSNKQL